jgi:hypothetical protein
MSYASTVSASSAFSSGRLRTKSGARPTPWSAPSSHTWRAEALTPAILSRSRRRTPVHLAVPTAPFSHCTPATGGSKNARPLPAHSSVTTRVVDGARLMSASVSVTGVSTSPSMTSFHPASSIVGV